MKLKNLEDCNTDVMYFFNLFEANNFILLMEQTNRVRANLAIAKNRPIPAFSDKEMRQVVGILMYMSVDSLSSLYLYWRSCLRIDMVASVISKDLRANLSKSEIL